MARPTRMTDADVTQALAALPGWRLGEGRIVREIKFRDFSEAWAFMTRVALHAEKLDHHPDWSNVYNRVRIELNTHDAGGITSLDLTLARLINDIAPA